MDESRRTLKAFSNEMGAYLLKGRLELEGIPASVHRYSRYRAMAGGGYLLKVRNSDFEKAQSILTGFDTEIDMDEYVDSDDKTVRRCPQCNSVNVKPRPLPRKQAMFSLLTFGILLLFLRRDWDCRKCGHHRRG